MSKKLDIFRSYYDLIPQFSEASEKLDNSAVVVGMNDYQQAPRGTTISEAAVNVDCIAGHIDMGDQHAMFKYSKDHVGFAAQIANDLDPKEVKFVVFCLPRDRWQNDISDEYKAWFGYIQNSLKSRGIASDYTLHSSKRAFSSENANSNKGKVLQFQKVACL